jgi:hypothetical protein
MSTPGFFMKGQSALHYQKKYWLTIVVTSLAILYGLTFLLIQPCLFVESEQDLLNWFVISSGKEAFSLRFIHSVERTPVLEKYQVDSQNNLLLFATEYESFGVGLPFLASEGHFIAKDGHFILEMNRVFPSINFRTWPEAQLTLTVKNQQYRLHQMLPSGSVVRLSAGTWLLRLINISTTKLSKEGG